MCKTRSFVIVCFAVLACVAPADATDRGHREIAAPLTSGQLARSTRDLPTIVVVKPFINEPLLQIENLRLESAPPKAPQPSALLKFDVLNDTSLRLTDVVMRVSFVEKRSDELDVGPGRVVVGPVTVRVAETLRAGYLLSYEMLFRNFSSDCGCTARVEILSARLLPD
jgi:hypothetical protein